MALLKQTNIVNGRLIYIRAKTKKPFSVKLLPEALAILDEMAQVLNTGGYLFPVLSAFHKTERQKLNRLTNMSDEINRMLREISLEYGIRHHITFYVARHSYATVLKRSGVSTAIISETMGHASETITQIYLDSFEQDTLDSVALNLI